MIIQRIPWFLIETDRSSISLFWNRYRYLKSNIRRISVADIIGHLFTLSSSNLHIGRYSNGQISVGRYIILSVILIPLEGSGTCMATGFKLDGRIAVIHAKKTLFHFALILKLTKLQANMCCVSLSCSLYHHENN